MSRDNDLPFALGATYYGGDAVLLAAIGTDEDKGLEGKIYETKDPVSGLPQRVIVLKNRHSTVVTGGRGVLPSAGYIDRRTGDFVGTAGAFGYIVHPEYARLGISIAVNDLYYAVYDGHVSNVRLGASNAVDLAIACFDAAGYQIPVGSTDPAHLTGRFAEAVTSTGQGNETVDMIVGRNAANGLYGT